MKRSQKKLQILAIWVRFDSEHSKMATITCRMEEKGTNSNGFGSIFWNINSQFWGGFGHIEHHIIYIES